LNLGGDRRNSEGDPEFHGNFGVDFDDVAPGGESFGGEAEAIDAEWQILKNEVAVGRNLETALEVVSCAEEFAFGGEAGTFRIADFEMEFTAEALGARGHRRDKAEERGQGSEAD
jgi:hypothetical protein